MHILDKIVAYKKEEVKRLQQLVPLSKLKNSALYSRTCNSYVNLLEKKNNSGVIAEFKRKSPSRSNINLDANLLSVTRAYANGGANAISILTDQEFFGGNNGYLKKVRKALPEMPLLRKEFTIDQYQIHEAKAIGADLILLICEILTKDDILNFTAIAKSLGMEVLLEMHSADQIRKCNADVSVVGVNNRNLKTFEVDYERSKDLFDKLPVDIPKIAESGLSDPDTCVMLYQHGFRGFLIGEQFMKQKDPGLACEEFIFEYMVKRGTS